MADSATSTEAASNAPDPAAAPAQAEGGGEPAQEAKEAHSGTALGQAIGDKEPEAVSTEEAKTEVPLEIDLPAGVSIDAGMLESFKSVAGEIGLTSEAASKLVAWQASQQEVTNSAQAESWSKQGEAWAKEIQEHPEFGGDNFKDSLLSARKALRQHGGDTVATALDDMGLGNHPALFHMFVRIGNAMGEDTSDTGGKSSSGPSTMEEKLSKFYNKSG